MKFKEMSDEDLLLALAEGESEALDVLFLRHSGRVLSYAQKRGLSPEQAQDLVQIVFLQIFRKKHLYDPKHPAQAWLYVIARSELKDYRNREIKDHQEWQESLSQNTPVAPIENELKDEVQHLIRDLKPKDQEIIKLRYLDELEYNEIAQRLKESESNVRQIISRSLKFLRRRHERH